MPQGKALKVLPPELPKEYREFVACTRDTLEVPPGPLTWAKMPGVPDSLKPSATFEPGENGAVKVTISAAGLSLQVDISVSKHGNLKADTSSWPTDTPFIGDQLKDLAKGVSNWVDDLNGDFRKNNKKVGSLRVVNGRLTGSKAALDARTAMADTTIGDEFAVGASTPPEHAFGPTIGRMSHHGEKPIWEAGDGMAVPDVTALDSHLEVIRRRNRWGLGRVAAPQLVGIGAGLVITVASAGFLVFGGTAPTGDGSFVLPPIGPDLTFTGTLATSDLDFEVLNDISSELVLTFPDSGGLIDGSANVKYEARSSSGTAFTNTSALEVRAAFDWYANEIYGVARHIATGEAGGQQQVRELSPLFVHLTYDPATGGLTGGFQGVGFSYPVIGTTTDQVSTADPGNVSRDGTFDATVLDRTDTTETVLENSWQLFVNAGDKIAGVGVLRVNQAFDSDALGADCTFEAIRVARMSGTFDPASGAVTGSAMVLAWGNKSDSCTFETGVAAEEAAVTGNLATSSGELELVINASETVAGPFDVNASFDAALFAAPGQGGVGDKTLPIAGLAVGIGLVLTSLGLGLVMKRPERGAGAES